MTDQRFAFPHRLSRLLGIKYPIIQGGMIWVSGWKLVRAVSESGGLGVLGAGSMDIDLLRKHIHKLQAAQLKQAWGVNIPLFFKHADAMIELCQNEKVPVVITSGGSPKLYTQALQDRGIKVLHVCASPRLALKCQQARVDAVIVEGFEAGGHNGRDELTTFSLLAQTHKLVDIPLIAAGGVYNGSTMLAAFALGADGVQVGSRYAITVESSAHDNFKQAVIKAQAEDTRLIMKALVPVRVIKNEWARAVMQQEAAGADADKLREMLGKGRSKLGVFDGDIEQGRLEIGQCCGDINKIMPAAELMQELLEEYQLAYDRLQSFASSS